MKKPALGQKIDEKIAIPFSSAIAHLIREKQTVAARLSAEINAFCELTVLEGGGDMTARWRMSPSGMGMEREPVNPGQKT